MISSKFTLEDIREVRRQISEETAGMSQEEIAGYFRRGAIECQRLMDARRKELAEKRESGEQ